MSANRWPRKPPPGTQCDAHVGASYDHTGKPVIHRCPNEAGETVMSLGMEMWVCDTCVWPLAARGHVKRNPRRFPQQPTAQGVHAPGGGEALPIQGQSEGTP